MSTEGPCISIVNTEALKRIKFVFPEEDEIEANREDEQIRSEVIERGISMDKE